MIRRIVVWCSVGTGLLAWAACQQGANTAGEEGFDGQHRHRTSEEWERYMEALEDPDRSSWQKPQAVVKALALRPGERVADIGAGTGYFSVPIAKAVGPRGRVYGVDVSRQMIDYLSDRIHRDSIGNIVPILAPSNNPTLPANGVDTVLIVNTYHHLDGRASYLAHLDKALAPGGRIVIIDFVPRPREERGFGPPLGMQLSRETLDAELSQAGFAPAKVHDFLAEQFFVEYRRR
ncbi:MAG: methyltransferase [Phycisphaerales bacterium]|nr:MAG: methyltransferase [Phycisphaerales bacterium]